LACDHVQWSCKHVYLTVRVQGGESAARRAWSGEYRAALLGRRRWGGVAAAHLLHGCALRHCVAEVGPLGLLGVLVRLVLRLLQLGLHTRLLALCEVALLVRLRLRLPLELLLLAQVLPPLRQQLEHVGRLRLRVGFLHGGPRVVACRSGGASVRRCRRCLSEAPREARQATPRYHATTLTSCGSGPLRCGGATRALGVATRRAARHRLSQREAWAARVAPPRRGRAGRPLSGLWAAYQPREAEAASYGTPERAPARALATGWAAVEQVARLGPFGHGGLGRTLLLLLLALGCLLRTRGSRNGTQRWRGGGGAGPWPVCGGGFRRQRGGGGGGGGGEVHVPP
jgi:hypothetical protein